MTEIKWCAFAYDHYGLEGCFSDPVPLFYYINEQNKKMNQWTFPPNYMECYALMDFCKNAFVIKSPIDLNINIDIEKEYVEVTNADQKFFDDFFVVRDSNEFGIKRMGLTLPPKLLFFSQESVDMESMPFTILPQISPIYNKLTVIPGRFNIGKWIRPIEVSGEIINKTKNILLKKDDPMMIVRFFPKKGNVKLQRVYQNEEIMKASYGCTHMKKYVRKTPLEKCYQAMDGFLRHLGFKKKI